eukprot:7389599-Prymnesium_polylepis.2
MVAPLAYTAPLVEMPFASFTPSRRSVAPCSSNTRERCWASIVAPSPSDNSCRSTPGPTKSWVPSRESVLVPFCPGMTYTERLEPARALLAMASRSWGAVATVMKPGGPGMSGGTGGGSGGDGGVGGDDGDSAQPGIATPPSAIHVPGQSAVMGALRSTGVPGGLSGGRKLSRQPRPAAADSNPFTVRAQAPAIPKKPAAVPSPI